MGQQPARPRPQAGLSLRHVNLVTILPAVASTIPSPQTKLITRPGVGTGTSVPRDPHLYPLPPPHPSSPWKMRRVLGSILPWPSAPMTRAYTGGERSREGKVLLGGVTQAGPHARGTRGNCGEGVGWHGPSRGDTRTTMLLGSIDSTAARNLCCVCWYSSLCSNAKKERPLLDSSSRIDRPGESAASGPVVFLDRNFCMHPA